MIQKIKISENSYKCAFCNKEYSKFGIDTHIWRMHGNGKNHDPNIGYEKKNRKVWNKGLTKENDERVKKGCLKFSENLKSGKTIPGFLNKKHNDKTILKLKKTGGIRKGSGRGKSGWYKGYWCDSTWELAYVIYNLDHNIKFKRNNKGFEYQYKNKKHKYYPDFVLEDNTYIEIKGYLTEQNIEKIKQFKNNLIVINKNNIFFYINYVKIKYNINKIFMLYDDNKNKYTIKKNKENKRLKKIEERKQIIRQSNIDFTKYGWGKKLSKILKISSQQSIRFIKYYMLNELNIYFSHIK